MPSVTVSFIHALIAAAGWTLTPDGQVLSNGRAMHELPPLTGAHIDEQTQFGLIEAIAAAHPDRVGLVARYADAIRPDALGVLGLALKSAPTLGASLIRLERYFRLLSDTAVYRLHRDSTQAALVLEGRTPDHPALTLRNECALAAVMRNLHGFVAKGLELERVTFRHACPDDPDRYAAHFGCPVEFDAPQDAVVMPRHMLDVKNRIGDAAISDFLTQHLDQALRAMRPAPRLRTDLFRRLPKTLSTGVPQAAVLAHELGMSERSFFRHLAEEGTTYRDVVRDVQISLARELLQRRDCTLTEVAFLTGFAEQSSFGRAFKRSVGQTPAQFRNAACDTARLPAPCSLAGAAQRLADGADTMRGMTV